MCRFPAQLLSYRTSTYHYDSSLIRESFEEFLQKIRTDNFRLHTLEKTV